MALIGIIIYFVARRLMSVKEAMACIPKGFIAMVPAILILTMATTLKYNRPTRFRHICSESFKLGRCAQQSFARNYIHCSLPYCICNRYLVGHLRNTYSDCTFNIPRRQ